MSKLLYRDTLRVTDVAVPGNRTSRIRKHCPPRQNDRMQAGLRTQTSYRTRAVAQAGGWLQRTTDSGILVLKESSSPYGRRTDHDRLYKELLQTFLAEFVQLFFPELFEAIDFSTVTFLPQEVFTDVTKGERRSVDVLAKGMLKGRQVVLIIHLEHQSYKQADFHERMFVYFSRLYEKHRHPIVPIAVFSHRGETEEPDRFEVTFPFKNVLQFSFYTLQLRKKNWRAYLRSDNPVAAALLSQMNYGPEERVQVKKEFLRMLTRLELDPARMQLIVGFFEI